VYSRLTSICYSCITQNVSLDKNEHTKKVKNRILTSTTSKQKEKKQKRKTINVYAWTRRRSCRDSPERKRRRRSAVTKGEHSFLLYFHDTCTLKNKFCAVLYTISSLLEELT
jgi:hypothetical protein